MLSENGPPAYISRACLILGVPWEELTRELVIETWKWQIIKVHPDQSGDLEASIFLNCAKDTLISWLEGDSGHGWNAGAGVPRGPLPNVGSAAVALPLPQPDDKSET